MVSALLIPNALKMSKTIELPPIDDFIILTLMAFTLMFLVLHLYRPKDKEGILPDGYHELYNSNNQLTKKGLFQRGEQVSGIRYIYKKDGSLSHIEKCLNGVYTADTST